MRTGRLAAAAATAAVLLTTAGCANATEPNSHAGAAGTSAAPSSSAPSSSAPSSSALSSSALSSSAPPASTAASSTAPSSTAPSSTAPSSTAAATTAAPATAAPNPTKVPARPLAAGLSTLFGTGSSYSVAALDLTTGRSIRSGANGGVVVGSLMKLDILETLLYQGQRGGQGVSDGDEDDVEAMIEHSDNAAADRLYDAIGENAGLSGYHTVLGLRRTILDSEGHWGLSTTSADDQLLLLQALTSARSPLTAASRKYALALMGQVESDQRWGVSAAADPGSATALKNGWLGIDDDNELWAVDSAGLVQVGGHPVLMVVLSQHQPDFSTAVDRVQRAAVQLAAAL